jgi:flagellar hook protein FlgE
LEHTTDGLTQFAGEFAISFLNQDGLTFGNFAGITIDNDGVMTALFDNGEQLAVYQIPLALFANPNGMIARDGNAYSQSDRSGQVLLNPAQLGGAGRITASALEASNVDLAEEFARMIVTQRAYSASAKIITSADEMLEELIRIR